jgi:hypothetical protein
MSLPIFIKILAGIIVAATIKLGPDRIFEEPLK